MVKRWWARVRVWVAARILPPSHAVYERQPVREFAEAAQMLESYLDRCGNQRVIYGKAAGLLKHALVTFVGRAEAFVPSMVYRGGVHRREARAAMIRTNLV